MHGCNMMSSFISTRQCVPPFVGTINTLVTEWSQWCPRGWPVSHFLWGALLPLPWDSWLQEIKGIAGKVTSACKLTGNCWCMHKCSSWVLALLCGVITRERPVLAILQEKGIVEWMLHFPGKNPNLGGCDEVEFLWLELQTDETNGKLTVGVCYGPLILKEKEATPPLS